MTGSAVLTVILVLVPLVAIFGYLIYRGIGSVNLAFLTKTPKPPGEVGGGMANAIAGPALILALASLLGVPLALEPASIWRSMAATAWNVIRFTADVLNGVPSIVVGIVAYASSS